MFHAITNFVYYESHFERFDKEKHGSKLVDRHEN